MDGTQPDSSGICENPDCRIAETGKCVEGLELVQCSHYGKVPSPAVTPEDALPALELPSGAPLDRDGVGAVLRRNRSRVVAMVGPRESGKTSLIASLYDLFQTEPVGDWLFGGAQTLHAFERACHDTRASSRRDVPVMQRTPVGDVQFYHINVARQGTREAVALLLGDRSGELYSAAGDDSTLADGFDEVARADVVTLLVDGERLVDAGKRHAAQLEVRTIMRVLVEAGHTCARQRLAIVLTKADLFKAHAAQAAVVDSDFQRLVQAIRTEHDAHFAQIEAFVTAASPQGGQMMRGSGVDAVMGYWLQPLVAPVVEVVPRGADERCFSLLAVPKEAVDA